MNDYLMHYGVLGMKWGVRNYQNADGSLTAAGKARYYAGKVGSAVNKIGKEASYRYSVHKHKKDVKNAQRIRMQWAPLTYGASIVQGKIFLQNAEFLARLASSIYFTPGMPEQTRLLAKYGGTALWALNMAGIGSAAKNAIDVTRYKYDKEYKQKLDDLALHPNKNAPKREQ